jgi:NAD(P)H-hydrate repair Nnr-like enzyme with NAD(P)H-hydrate dehydratase domain
MQDYWQKQDLKNPLYEDLVWSKPEQKNLAGNLLIIGGNAHAVSAPGEAFSIAMAQGIGTTKVVVPVATKRLFGSHAPVALEFADSNPSGSFSTRALPQLQSYVQWSDAVLFAGDIGRNSETAILLEKLLEMPNKYIFTRDAADYFMDHPTPLLHRDQTLLVLSFAQLQKYAQHTDFKKAFTYDMSLMAIVETVQEFSSVCKSYFVTEHKGTLIIAVDGKVITTLLPTEPEKWRLKVASAASVWWLQNPTQPLKALATAITQLGW